MNTTISNGLNLGVKIGGKELICSGVVHLDQPSVEITLDTLNIEFCFVDDGGQARYESRVESSTKLIFTLYNHNSSLGDGVYSPMEIGSTNNRRLYVTYRTARPRADGSQRSFEFALYRGEAV